jgi:hypothetical protein
MEEENTYAHFMQEGVTALCAYISNVLTEVFEDRLISCKLWLARSPDLNPCDFYLWGNIEDNLYPIISTYWMK